MKHWVDEILSRQGIELAPGRAERMVPGVEALNVEDPLRAKLPFEVDPTTYALVLGRLK